VSAPHRTETERLVLRRPALSDAEAIFAGYASDPGVTRYLGWPRHTVIDQTRGFLAFCDTQWRNSPCGPYVIESRALGTIIGSTGLDFETPQRAATGYVLARHAWGQGYASEALRAMGALAPSLGAVRLQALCHPDHRASSRVLEKCGFAFEGRLRRHSVFPNLDASQPQDALLYAIAW